MPRNSTPTLERLIRAGGRAHTPASDGELLEEFVAQRSSEAFAALLHRHGPMVWGVCRGMLVEADAEDAFQATFLVLVRKAGTISPRNRVANWLHGVATNVSRKLRAMNARRPVLSTTAEPASSSTESAHDTELLGIEMAKLPSKYREAVVLCELEGRTIQEAAAGLGCRPGTIASRLHRGREMLRERLTARGLTAGAVSAILSSPAWGGPPARVMDLCHSVADGRTGVSATAQHLARKAINSMSIEQFKPWAAAMAFVLAVTIGGWCLANDREESPDATPTVLVEELVSRPTAPQPRLVLRPFEGGKVPQNLIVTSDGKRMIAWDREGTIRVLDMATGLPLVDPIRIGSAIQGVVVSPDGKWMAPVRTERTKDHSLIAWNTATGKRVLELAATPFDALAFSPDRKVVAIGRGTGVRLVDTQTLREVRKWDTGGTIAILRYSNDGKTLFASDRGQPVSAWDAANGQPKFGVGSVGATKLFAYSPDGKKIAWKGFGPPPVVPPRFGRPNPNAEQLFVADAATGVVESSIDLGKMEPNVTDLAFTRDSQFLLTRERIGMTLWKPATGNMFISWFVSDAGLASIAPIPDADIAAIGTSKGGIEFRRVYTPEMPRFRDRRDHNAPSKYVRIEDADPATTTHLSFEDEKMTDGDVAPVARFTELESLDFTCAKTITDRSIEHFKGLKKLHSLSLESDAITDKGMERLSEMTQFRHLTLICPAVTDEGLKHLKNLQNLESLTIEATKATPAVVEHLASLTKLQRLHVHGVLTDASAKHLNGLTELRDLSDWHCTLSDAGLTELHHLKKLEKLTLGRGKSKYTTLGSLLLMRAIPLLELN